MPVFFIALGLSVLGGLGGLLVASGLLLVRDSTRSALVPWLVSYAVGALLGASMLAILPRTFESLPPIVDDVSPQPLNIDLVSVAAITATTLTIVRWIV